MVWSGQWATKVVSGQHIMGSGILGYNSNSLWRDLPYCRSCIREPFRLKFPVQNCWNLRELSNIQTRAIKGGNCAKTWSNKSPIVQVWQTAYRPESVADCYITSCSLGFSCQKMLPRLICQNVISPNALKDFSCHTCTVLSWVQTETFRTALLNALQCVPPKHFPLRVPRKKLNPSWCIFKYLVCRE